MSKAQWIKENLKDGELYAGIVLGKDGAPDYHLVLLPSRDNKRMTWAQAMKAAKDIGGELPTRSEQAILYGNLKSEFESAWYWSGEQDAADPDYAWVQGFGDGGQNDGHESGECRARAVRRLLIIE